MGTHSPGTRGRGQGRVLHPPELVVGVAHLVRTELGDEDLDDADEDEEVDLQWSGVSPEGQGQGRGGQSRAAWSLPGQTLSLGSQGPRRCQGRGCGGQTHSPGLTRMARNTGKRRIHQMPMLLLVVQHLQRGRRGTAEQPLGWAAARPCYGIGSPHRASAMARHPAPCVGDGAEPLRGHHTIPTIPQHGPHTPVCAPHPCRCRPTAGAATHWTFS